MGDCTNTRRCVDAASGLRAASERGRSGLFLPGPALRSARRAVLRPGLYVRLASLAGLLLAGLAFASPAWAVPIVEWDLANATGQTALVLSADAHLSASAIAPSAGVTAWGSTAQDGFVAASGWAPAAPDPSRYYEWSVTAAAGYTVEYQSITLALFRGIQGPNHGAQQWDLHASTDAFATSDMALQSLDISSSAADTQVLFSALDISALGNVGGTVTFRLYGYDYSSASDYSGLGNDGGWQIAGTGANPLVDGNVIAVVPEPGTALLMLVGLAAMGLRRRA